MQRQKRGIFVIVWMSAEERENTTERFRRFPSQFNYSIKTTSRVAVCLEKYISVYSTWVFLFPRRKFHNLELFQYLQQHIFKPHTTAVRYFAISPEWLARQSSWLVPDFSESASLFQLLARTECATWEMGFCIRKDLAFGSSLCVCVHNSNGGYIPNRHCFYWARRNAVLTVEY